MPNSDKYTPTHRKSHSRSGSNSSSRRPSMTRSRSSQRLIRTISFDRNDEIAIDTSDNELDLDKVNDSLAKLNVDGESGASAPPLPSLSGLKVAIGSQNTKGQDGSSTEYIEIPYVKATIDSTLPQEYLRKDIINVAHILRIPKWYSKNSQQSKLDPTKVVLTKISGAMTNSIFRVEYAKLPSLLLRVYGSNNDTIIDRDYELQVLARLSIRNIGPSLYGCFENGRFEQYLENSTTLGRDNIRDWKTSQRIARRMKELHFGVPLLRSEIELGASCWVKIAKWLEIFETEGKDWIANDDNIKEAFRCENWEQFKRNIHTYHEWLYSSGKRIPPVVFCHNDAQYGNLLFTAPVVETSDSTTHVDSSATSISSATSGTSLFPSSSSVVVDQIINPTRQEQSQDSKLVVIDFEYAGPNPAAYDLANHLSEWMHDYSGAKPYKCAASSYPNKEQVLNFLYSYASHLQGGGRESRKINIDRDVKHLYNAIIRWRATVQLFWSVWAVLQSGTLDKNKDTGDVEEKEGPNGEVYIIKTENEADVSFSRDSDEELSDAADGEGVNVDTFDYIKYCSDKIAVCWSDLAGLGVVDEQAYIKDPDTTLDVSML
ncbi:bifunctional choline kinase/ethanolamine kinase [Maudiozyma humilis]|uniref:Bifunctional choline kinase/ethanolamine kinase n=1 Tax=Maudiozyma humilis TaxID=51915 RepID=A0AAV5SCD1_MAUHU|nr:bifunctional choline kinase/ethanolamine kinase [Kazachstania humilis]